MTRLLPVLAALTAALLFAGAAVAERSLTPHAAQYKVKISGLSAKLNTQLRHGGDGYVANHVIRPTGFSKLLTRGKMDVTAEFTTRPDGVVPVTFRSVDTIRKDPDVLLSFDWGVNEARGTVGGQDVVLTLDGISYDNVSIQYELMHDLMNGGTAERYALFDVDKMRIANVVDAGRKTIKTKLGRYEAVGIQHQKEGSSRVTTMWCVEELDYLPVIIEQHRKGKLNFKATLVSYTPTSD